MKLNRFLIVLFALVLLISLCACTPQDAGEGETTGGEGTTTSAETTTGGETTAGETTADTTTAVAKYKVTFKAEGVVVAVVEFEEGDTSVEEPPVPEKEGYTGEWEEYTLGSFNLTVRAEYTKGPNPEQFVLDLAGVFEDPTFELGRNMFDQFNVGWPTVENGKMTVNFKDGQAYFQTWKYTTQLAPSTYKIYYRARALEGNVYWAQFCMGPGDTCKVAAPINGTDQVITVNHTNKGGNSMSFGAGGDAKGIVFDYLQIVRVPVEPGADFDVTKLVGGVYSDPEFNTGTLEYDFTNNQNIKLENGQLILTNAYWIADWKHWGSFAGPGTFRVYFKGTGPKNDAWFSINSDDILVKMGDKLDGTHQYVDIVVEDTSNGGGFILSGGAGVVTFDYIQVVKIK